MQGDIIRIPFARILRCCVTGLPVLTSLSILIIRNKRNPDDVDGPRNCRRVLSTPRTIKKDNGLSQSQTLYQTALCADRNFGKRNQLLNLHAQNVTLSHYSFSSTGLVVVHQPSQRQHVCPCSPLKPVEQPIFCNIPASHHKHHK